MVLPAEGSQAQRAMYYIAFFFIAIIALKTISYLVSLFVVSLILAMLAYPAMQAMKRRGVPDILAVGIITVVAILVAVVFGLITLFSFDLLISDLPLYQEALAQRLSEITALLSKYGLNTGELSGSSIQLQSIVELVLSSMMNAGQMLMYIFFIGVTSFFMLLEAPRLTQRVTRLFGKESKKIAQISRMSRYMIEFVIVRTETNLVHGVLFGGSLWVMGVHAAALWGILTFLLGYIPYIGLIIAAIPAIFFAWLQFGLWGVVAVVVIVCILNLIVENPIFSYFASRKFEIPALVVIISVIVWGWLLGFAGMVFAVPMTLMVLLVIQSSDEFRWINEVLGVERLFEEETQEA